MRRLNIFLSILLFGTPACASAEGKRMRVSMAEAWRVAGELASGRELPCVKPWWHSKTVWFNFIVAGCLIAEGNIEQLQGLLPANTYKVIAFGLPIVNIWLRGLATQGLSFKPRMPNSEEDKG